MNVFDFPELIGSGGRGRGSIGRAGRREREREEIRSRDGRRRTRLSHVGVGLSPSLRPWLSPWWMVPTHCPHVAQARPKTRQRRAHQLIKPHAEGRVVEQFVVIDFLPRCDFDIHLEPLHGQEANVAVERGWVSRGDGKCGIPSKCT